MSGDTEKDICYRDFFSFRCPRPIKVKDNISHSDIFKDCLFKNWEPVITEIVKELCIDPPKLNQIIKGRIGEREFNKEPLDELIALTETKVKAKLRVTTGGIDFYKEGKSTSIKALTFCILGCQLLQLANERWRLSKIKTKILNVVLVHYYLDGINVTNATLQDIERNIEKRENTLKDNHEITLLKESFQEDDTFSETEEDNESFDIFSHDIDFTEGLDKEEVDICPLESPLLLPRDKLKQLDLFTIDDYFLEGDQELTDAFQKICSNEDCESKRCITCDVSHEFYYLAARKLIHLFIYKNELFDGINLSAECLMNEQIDISDLRRRMELFLRQTTEWKLSQQEMNKFILCTLCHLIRHFRLLGQIDMQSAIKSFFGFLGIIYQLPEQKLRLLEQNLFEQLGLNDVVGGKHATQKSILQLLQESDLIPNLPHSPNNQEEKIKHYLQTLWNENPHLQSKTEEEREEFHKKAKRVVRERRAILPSVWEQVEHLRPYLAYWLLQELNPKGSDLAQDKQLKTDQPQISKQPSVQKPPQMNVLSFNLKNISEEDIEQLYEIIVQCDSCTASQGDCKNSKGDLRLKLSETPEKLSELWSNNPHLQTCIAKVLIEKYETGEI